MPAQINRELTLEVRLAVPCNPNSWEWVLWLHCWDHSADVTYELAAGGWFDTEEEAWEAGTFEAEHTQRLSAAPNN